jgi:hypothetical protein
MTASDTLAGRLLDERGCEGLEEFFGLPSGDEG